MAFTMNSQWQSPFVMLPPELKRIIFAYALQSDGPILDPDLRSSSNNKAQRTSRCPQVPSPAVNLMQTCHRLHLDLRGHHRLLLLSQNTFRFTHPDRMDAFFSMLDAASRSWVRRVELDLFSMEPQHLHGSLGLSIAWAENATHLVSLQIDASGWTRSAWNRSSTWHRLHSVLSLVSDFNLERIVVVGRSRGANMDRLSPWSPVHYCGSDDVITANLPECMVAVLERRHDKGRSTNDGMWTLPKEETGEPTSADMDKILKWERRDGLVYLALVSRSYLARNEPDWQRLAGIETCSNPWPVNGFCTWFAYKQRYTTPTQNRFLSER